MNFLESGLLYTLLFTHSRICSLIFTSLLVLFMVQTSLDNEIICMTEILQSHMWSLRWQTMNDCNYCVLFEMSPVNNTTAKCVFLSSMKYPNWYRENCRKMRNEINWFVISWNYFWLILRKKNYLQNVFVDYEVASSFRTRWL